MRWFFEGIAFWTRLGENVNYPLVTSTNNYSSTTVVNYALTWWSTPISHFALEVPESVLVCHLDGQNMLRT